jgi:hypothetical protein
LPTHVIPRRRLFDPHSTGRETQSAALAKACAVPFSLCVVIGSLVSLAMNDAWIAASAQGPASAAEAGTTLPVRMRGTQPGHEQGPYEDRDQGLNYGHGQIAKPLSMKPMLKHVCAQKPRRLPGSVDSRRRKSSIQKDRELHKDPAKIRVKRALGLSFSADACQNTESAREPPAM